MSSNPRIRASDQDRDRTAELLREHHALGRLDAAEFAERIDKSFSARTVNDLDDLTADLPAIDLYPLPAASLPRNRVLRTDRPASSALDQVGATAGKLARSASRLSPKLLTAWGAWSLLLAICLVLWTVGVSAWPLLAPVAVGAILGGRWLLGPKQLPTPPNPTPDGQLNPDNPDNPDKIEGPGTPT
jgi:hypothetical protein